MKFIFKFSYNVVSLKVFSHKTQRLTENKIKMYLLQKNKQRKNCLPLQLGPIGLKYRIVLFVVKKQNVIGFLK